MIEMCDVSFVAHVVEEISEYSSLIRKSMEYKNPNRIWGGWESSCSEEYSKVHQSTTFSNNRFVYNTAICEIYQAVMKKYDHPPIDHAFITAVESLPSYFSMDNDFSVNRFMKFFKAFGTHVVEKIVMGSKLVFASSFSVTEWNDMVEQQVAISDASSFAFNLLLGGGLASTEEYASQESSANTFLEKTESYDIFTIGARPPDDGNVGAWAIDTKVNPQPIRYSIVPIYEYSYVDADGVTIYLIDQEKRNAFIDAMKEYPKILQREAMKKRLGGISSRNFECDLTEGIIYRGKCFKYFNESRSWYAARDACEEFEGNLATFRSIEEVKWILYEVTNAQFWIGLNDIDEPNVFRLPNGEVVDYTNWNNGEPTGGAYEECVYSIAGTGLWNDIWCYEKMHFVCERGFVGESYEKKTSLSCDDGVIYNNSSCIKIMSNWDLTWYESRLKCKEWDLDADLVSILTQDKNDFLYGLASTQGVDQFWIGLSDILKNLVWRWVNGKHLIFQNNWGAWTSNYCGFMNVPTYSGKWGTTNCNGRGVGAFVCEKSYMNKY